MRYKLAVTAEYAAILIWLAYRVNNVSDAIGLACATR